MKTDQSLPPKRHRWLRHHLGQTLVVLLLIAGVVLVRYDLVRNYPRELAQRWAAATFKAMPDVKAYQRQQAAQTPRAITPSVSLPLPEELLLPLQRIIPGGPYDNQGVTPVTQPAHTPPDPGEEVSRPRPAR